MPRNKEAVIARLIARWKPRLLLHKWAILTVLKEEDLPVAAGNIVYLAQMTVNSRYFEARLDIYPSFWEASRAAQEVTIIHEMGHIITEPILAALTAAVSRGVVSEKRKVDLTEDTTEYIAKLMYKAYSKRRKPSSEYHL